MSALQILAVVAALWVAASVLFCVRYWPRIAARLRTQHHAPDHDRDREGK